MLLSAAALLLAACASDPPPAAPNRPTREEFETALQDQYSQMVELVQRQRQRLGGGDLDEVIVVPVDRLEVDIQGYVNDAYKRTLSDMFIDQISNQELQAGTEELAVVPYDAPTFYRIMQTVGLQQIEDCVMPANIDKIQQAMQKEGGFVHGFARLKLQQGLGERDYLVRIEFVPLNGSPPIRTRGRNVPSTM
jgi:hypothetical protein